MNRKWAAKKNILAEEETEGREVGPWI